MPDPIARARGPLDRAAVMAAGLFGATIPGEPSVTAREIAQQPAAWREVAERSGSPTAFIADALARPGLRVILTGAGSSALAGEIAAPALRAHLRAGGARVEAIATTDLVARPTDHFEPDVPTLLVSFARSGDSPESLAATELADELIADVRHLVFTCDPSGRLARVHRIRADSRVCLMPKRTNDAGFAMTSSLTCMLLSCLLLLGPADADTASALARAAEAVLDDGQAIRDLALATRQRVVYLGSGALAGVAHESALKLLELTAGEVVTYFDTPLGFRHGPKAILDAQTQVVVFVSTDPHTRRYDLDIVSEIRDQLGADAVTVVSTVAPRSETGPAHVLAGLDGLGDAACALPYLVFAQCLALFIALERGKTPDDPFPAGEVSRVVKGVTIHPMARPGRGR